MKQWSDNGKKKVTMSFNYSGIRYWYVSITDTEFENIYLQYPDGNYNYRENCLLVVSLRDMYTDKKHYKPAGADTVGVGQTRLPWLALKA
ncbi:hypothetical protein L9W92_02305 [Pelotomaculum terephthalicicum JT]|nr:hypothetical protein [Pelotomaculum terephthalicicum]MCG9966891.1 hypothetical protein [Pelotomaculum terephthalicicum JT]